MKKGLLALTVFSTLSTLSLKAGVCCGDPCCPPPCDPCCDPCSEHLFVERCQLFITGEFLYWTTDVGAMDYAVKMDKTTTARETFAIGDYKVADYDWRPGYRVALAWYNYPKYWEVTGQYTWLFDKGSDSTRVATPGETGLFLNPTVNTETTGLFRRARSLVDLHYHLGDLYVARVFDPNPHLRMRVYGGFTAAYIEQSWKKRYSDFLGNFDRLKDKWHYWAGGFRMGVTSDWFWGNCFYVTGRVSFATLIGSYKNESIQVQNGDLLVRDSTYKDHRFSFHTQFIIGPSWQMPCDCWSIEIFAGYEFNVWLNLHETIRTGRATPQNAQKETSHNRGVLGMQGLTARLTLGF